MMLNGKCCPWERTDIILKLWIDDVRPAPEGYDKWAHSINEAKQLILEWEEFYRRIAENFGQEWKIELIDIDYDAGDYVSDGGDYIKLLNWLEETGRNYPIHIHTDNAVTREHMRAIIERNSWKEVM